MIRLNYFVKGDDEKEDSSNRENDKPLEDGNDMKNGEKDKSAEDLWATDFAVSRQIFLVFSHSGNYVLFMVNIYCNKMYRGV